MKGTKDKIPSSKRELLRALEKQEKQYQQDFENYQERHYLFIDKFTIREEVNYK